jgi:hypothetical protein
MRKLAISFLVAAVAATAASYRVELYQPSEVAGQQLKPGQYTVEVKDNTVIWKQGKKTVQAPAKLETGDTKYSSNTVRYNNEGAKYRIQELRLGGTNTKLVFETGSTSAGN